MGAEHDHSPQQGQANGAVNHSFTDQEVELLAQANQRKNEAGDPFPANPTEKDLRNAIEEQRAINEAASTERKTVYVNGNEYAAYPNIDAANEALSKVDGGSVAILNNETGQISIATKTQYNGRITTTGVGTVEQNRPLEFKLGDKLIKEQPGLLRSDLEYTVVASREEMLETPNSAYYDSETNSFVGRNDSAAIRTVGNPNKNSALRHLSSERVALAGKVVEVEMGSRTNTYELVASEADLDFMSNRQAFVDKEGTLVVTAGGRKIPCGPASDHGIQLGSKQREAVASTDGPAPATEKAEKVTDLRTPDRSIAASHDPTHADELALVRSGQVEIGGRTGPKAGSVEFESAHKKLDTLAAHHPKYAEALRQADNPTSLTDKVTIYQRLHGGKLNDDGILGDLTLAKIDADFAGAVAGGKNMSEAHPQSRDELRAAAATRKPEINAYASNLREATARQTEGRTEVAQATQTETKLTPQQQAAVRVGNHITNGNPKEFLAEFKAAEAAKKGGAGDLLVTLYKMSQDPSTEGTVPRFENLRELTTGMFRTLGEAEYPKAAQEWANVIGNDRMKAIHQEYDFSQQKERTAVASAPSTDTGPERSAKADQFEGKTTYQQARILGKAYKKHGAEGFIATLAAVEKASPGGAEGLLETYRKYDRLQQEVPIDPKFDKLADRAAKYMQNRSHGGRGLANQFKIAQENPDKYGENGGAKLLQQILRRSIEGREGYPKPDAIPALIAQDFTAGRNHDKNLATFLKATNLSSLKGVASVTAYEKSRGSFGLPSLQEIGSDIKKNPELAKTFTQLQFRSRLVLAKNRAEQGQQQTAAAPRVSNGARDTAFSSKQVQVGQPVRHANGQPVYLAEAGNRGPVVNGLIDDISAGPAAPIRPAQANGRSLPHVSEAQLANAERNADLEGQYARIEATRLDSALHGVETRADINQTLLEDDYRRQTHQGDVNVALHGQRSDIVSYERDMAEDRLATQRANGRRRAEYEQDLQGREVAEDGAKADSKRERHNTRRVEEKYGVSKKRVGKRVVDPILRKGGRALGDKLEDLIDKL